MTRYLLEIEIYMGRRRRSWDFEAQAWRLADLAGHERRLQAEGTRYRLTEIVRGAPREGVLGCVRALPKGSAIRAAKAEAAGPQNGRQMELALW